MFYFFVTIFKIVRHDFIKKSQFSRSEQIGCALKKMVVGQNLFFIVTESNIK